MIAVKPSTWARRPLRSFNLGTAVDSYHSYQAEAQSPALRDGIPSTFLSGLGNVFIASRGDFYCSYQQVFESNNHFCWEVCLTLGSVSPSWNLSNVYVVKNLELFA